MRIYKNVKNGERFDTTDYKFDVQSQAEEIKARRYLREYRAMCLSDAEFKACFKQFPRKGYTVWELQNLPEQL